MQNNDTVILAVGNTRIDKFITYQIDNDLYEPENPFSFSCDSLIGIKAGMTCRIFINNQLELTGIIDSVARKMNRNGAFLEISGRSLASVLTDSCVTNFKGGMPGTLPAIVDRLLKDVPFISKKNFIFKSGSDKSRIKKDFLELSPGDTIFDVLKRAANSQGFIFYMAPDGSFIVDKPIEIGEPSFTIHDSQNDFKYIEGSVEEDISNAHSEVIVMGECQTADGDYKVVKARAQNPDYHYRKPLVVSWNEADGPAKKVAEMKIIEEKASSMTLQYNMNGHSQNGKNWMINKFCTVIDRYNGVEKASFLITRRSFSLTRTEGKKTELTLERGGRL